MTGPAGPGDPSSHDVPMRGAWRTRLSVRVQDTFATLFRPPRGPVAWPSTTAIVLSAVAIVAVILLSMTYIDASAARQARQLPAGLRTAAGHFTNLGKGAVFLWPLGLAILALAAIGTTARVRFPRAILAAVTVRAGFMFTAIAFPGLIETIAKRLIGRARPFVRGDDVWAFVPGSWSPAYASFPSGHTTVAFSALVAIGALYPQTRALMWIYAILIALSRVIINAHYPSDAIGGAITGAVGAILIRDWFAARRLGFIVDSGGNVRPMPGPGVPRIMKAVARCLRSVRSF